MNDYKIADFTEMPDVEVNLTDKDGYFYPFEHDAWAESTMNEDKAITFDWSRIEDVDLVDKDNEWETHPLNRSWSKRGIVTSRWLVSCQKHGFFKTVFVEKPENRQLGKCPHCITDEINRIIDLRAKREADERRMSAK